MAALWSARSPSGSCGSSSRPCWREATRPSGRRSSTGSAALALPVFEAHPQEPAAQPGEDDGLSVLHGLFWLAANLADRQPLLIAVDDLHWCDTPSLEWLGYLARRLEGAPIVVAVTFRPAEVEADPVLVDELTDDPSRRCFDPLP